MSKYILCIVMLVVATSAHRQHHPPKTEKRSIAISSINGGYRKVPCFGFDVRRREKMIEKSRCGIPKDVFVHLDPNISHEVVSPSAVWVKRCVGVCEYDNTSCVPTKTDMQHIPVRVYNAKTNKEIVAMYPVEEHVTCGCCTLGLANCTALELAPYPTVSEYNRLNCSCQRRSMEERRQCLETVAGCLAEVGLSRRLCLPNSD